MIQADQFFNKPVVNSSIVVHMAHEMLKHQCNLQMALPLSRNRPLLNQFQHDGKCVGCLLVPRAKLQIA